MLSEKKLILEVLFNSWGKSPDRLTREWIGYRLNLFINYTLRSLRLQSSQDFICYLTYDPKCEDILLEELGKYPPLPSNVRFVTPIVYKRSVKSEIPGYKYLYRIYLASDDMYHKDFIKFVHDYVPRDDTIALVPQYGYAYDSTQHRLGKLFFWLPAYGAVIIRADDYLKGSSHNHTWRDALKVPREYIHVKEAIWINHIHGQNTGTTFQHLLNWKDKNGQDAFALEPWSNPDKPRACFGPEITDPDEIRTVLSDYF